jgi:class 3 adenylate cyclase
VERRPAIRDAVGVDVTRRRARAARWATAGVLPLAVLAFLLAEPRLDLRWEDDAVHFWIVLAAGLVSVAVGYAVRESGMRRRDARQFLIGLAFIASAGFLALHALATPGVLLGGKSAGFVIATPIGLLVAGCFAALSAVDFRPETAAAIMRRARLFTGALFAAMGVWAVLSVSDAPPLSHAVTPQEARGPLAGVAALGVLLFAAAAAGYYRLYRRRGARFVFAVSFAFALLAEALVVVVAALPTSWRLSWWEWHILMLLGFAFVAYSARREWHEERFSALYLDETLADTKEASILFADLQGFTPYSERTAPADVRTMLNTYFETLVPLLASHGGDVHQLIGDAIMVIFNARGDQPDHALRAARAGLALQEAAATIADGKPDWPRFRVGVNSGEVVVGLIGGETGHRKHGVVGDTVNLAARLEGKALAGEVVIGAGTYAALPDGVQVERLAELQVKGKSEPVEAYTLRSLGPAEPETLTPPATSTP